MSKYNKFTLQITKIACKIRGTENKPVPDARRHSQYKPGILNANCE